MSTKFVKSLIQTRDGDTLKAEYVIALNQMKENLKRGSPSQLVAGLEIKKKVDDWKDENKVVALVEEDAKLVADLERRIQRHQIIIGSNDLVELIELAHDGFCDAEQGGCEHDRDLGYLRANRHWIKTVMTQTQFE